MQGRQNRSRYQSPWVAVQRNPISGAGGRNREVVRLLKSLKSLGLTARLFSNREKLAGLLEDGKVRESLTCLVVAGGDGTVADAIQRYPSVPLTVLPLGTENLFAKYLGLSFSGQKLAHQIVAGHRRKIDVGKINGRYFTVMASVGFDADVIHRCDARRTGRITKWNYIRPIWESLTSYGHPRLRYTVDGQENSRSARFLIASNLPKYALGLRIADDAGDQDGLLHVTAFEQSSAHRIFQYFAYAKLGRLPRLLNNPANGIRQFSCHQICITSDENEILRTDSKGDSIPGDVPVQADGDPVGSLPVEISVCPKYLTTIVPPGFDDRYFKSSTIKHEQQDSDIQRKDHCQPTH